MADGLSEIKMSGHYVRVRAEVVDIPSFSVDADHDELVNWLGSATRPPDITYLVHGEPDASNALHDAIKDRLDWEAVVPRHLERVRLT